MTDEPGQTRFIKIFVNHVPVYRYSTHTNLKPYFSPCIGHHKITRVLDFVSESLFLEFRYNSFSTLVLNPQRTLINMAAKNNIPTPVDREQIFGMAEKEMEYRVELFNKLTHTCFNKCVEKRYKEAELNMGENSCIDRCVSKYWQVVNSCWIPIRGQ
ncbi:uncharacterized protein LOC114274392 isoform X2 [Camellia sinensis]|uniref:uncharacterized protein LOC114274392 isoform X2 n=1 Tax=Camellia sinensis TaxID=4442 RepID=UPI00103564D5|nr:uncharacterized protein LOC114274392 isoform X2 [Camellia sinensis]